MIAGCYSLDLYCEFDKRGDDVHEYGEFPHVYTNEFGSKCRRNAKRDGWKLSNKSQAICPKCVALGKTFKDLTQETGGE